ncbi:MAG: phytanoyl-CoA dioxygenase [Gammaproteobacteria bacterium]|nr:phytanoyl-CoA dioxygenase [Gammaproteobacteria bacterium]NKB64630.1 phytanoyl-CoA dioxygenase [Gammaproteobacteria bacterium]
MKDALTIKTNLGRSPLADTNTVEKFNVHGAVIIRGVFEDWVELLRDGIEKNINDPGPFVRDYRDSSDGRFFGDYCNWNRIPEYRRFLFESGVGDIANHLMGSKHARLFHEHVLVKEANTNIPTPWHHDQPYYCVDGKQNCSLWLALDQIDQTTSIEFVAGSHRWNKWFRPERFDKSPLFENDKDEVLPDIDANRDQYEILQWAVEPGDVIAFHFLTIHGAPPNLSNSSRRRAFSSRWVGDDATFAVRQGRTSPPFPHCKLQHGDVMSGDDFPIIPSRFDIQ